MIFVSLPVHEHPEVVIDQCSNFLKYLDCKIVLHVSKSSLDMKSCLNECLLKNKLSNRVIINPTSVETGWGRIIGAHLTNINFIVNGMRAVQDDKVVFHSSNDMFVRYGLTSYLNKKRFIFQNRVFLHPGFWLPGKAALKDEELKNFFKQVFGHFTGMCGSQIEGSMYPVDVLSRLLYEIKKNKLILSTNYPVEEILFPTYAKYMGVMPCASNYIFSEVNRVDRKIFDILLRIKKIIPALSDNQFFLRVVAYIVNRVKNSGKVTVLDVENIRNRYFENFLIKDSVNAWLLNSETTAIFGVKRVARNLKDPLRLYINSLDSPSSEQSRNRSNESL